MQFLLRTLGSPRVETRDGDPVAFPEGKPLALLVYLAVERRPVRRSELAHLLWPGSTRDRGFQSLRQALWVIRKTLGEEVVQGTDPVEVSREALVTDLELMAGEASLAPVDVALAPGEATPAPVDVALAPGEATPAPVDVVLAPGDAFPVEEKGFLELFALAGSPAWEDWVEDTGSRVRRLRASALHAAAAERRREGASGPAARLAREAIRHDPAGLEHHLLLAEILLDRLDGEGAARAVASARLEVHRPGAREALDALELRIAEQARGRPEAPSLRHPELVGRGGELAVLQSEWRRTIRGEPRGVVLRGNLGTGRTRLADELGRWVAAQGGVVVGVHTAEAEEALPLGYLSLLVSRLLTRPGGRGVSAASDALLRALVPSLQNRPLSPLEAPGAPATAALADAVRDLVGAVAHELPLLLVLDDLRWADESSRTLLLRVFRELRTEAVLFLMVLPRPRAPHRRGRSSLRGLEELEREGRVRTLLLEKLDRVQVRELLSMQLNLSEHPDADRVVAELHRVSGGNPLFLVEILELLRDRGLVAHRPEGWILEGPLPQELPLPSTIAEALDQRVASLEGPAAALAVALARGAARGADSDPQEVGRLEPVLSDPAAFRAAVDDLVAKGLARQEDGRLELAHEGVRAALDRRLGVGRADGAESRRGRVTRRIALAGVPLALLLAAWFATRPQVPPPYGGGELWVLLDHREEALLLDPPRRPGDGWRTRPAPVVPPTRSAHGPFLLEDRPVWFLDRVSSEASPWVSRWSPTDGERVILARPRTDVNFAGVAPDGSLVAVLSDDPDTPAYDMGLVVVDPDGGNPRTVLQAPGLMSTGGWAPDGSRLLALLPGAPDSLVTVTPTGERRESLALPAMERAAWCGGEGDIIVLAHDPADGPLLLLWDPGTDDLRRVPGARPLPSQLACTPDGRAVVYSEPDGPRVRLVLRELDSGEATVLPVAPPGPVRPTWVHPPRPILRSVAIEGAPDSLSLGERRPLGVRLTDSDGRPRQDPVAWRALDPGIVSVSPEGIVTGNRPGAGRIVATAGSWRSDTVEVAVREEAEGPDLLLQDHFHQVDPARWEPVGFPHPYPVILDDGEPALRIPGDGQHRDGIRTRQGFALDHGLTVELSVHLPLTRRDRQSVDIGLHAAGSLSAPGAAPGTGWGAGLTVMYPGRELERFDPRTLSVTVGSFGFPLPLPVEAEPGEWMRFALEIRPDGEVSLRVNGSVAGSVPLHLEVAPGEEWHLQVSGASVDTELLVRDLVVWRGVR